MPLFVLLSFTIACVVLFRIVVGPIAVKALGNMPAKPVVTVIGEYDLPPGAASYFDSIRPDLESLGFTFVDYVRVEGAARNVLPYLMFFRNGATMDMAFASVMFILGKKPKVHSYLEFYRKFAGAFEVDTNNSRTPGVFKKDPKKDVFPFPDVASPRRLFELHQKLAQRRTRSAPQMPPEGEEIDFFRANYPKSLKRQAEFGYLKLDHAIYRHTWKGACLMTWKLCWPIKSIRASLARRETASLVRELGL
ncbi:MAG TPA: hypothetical protein VJX67_04320 [Blastocatellia bacterium]|nr:hypothetical protein [Blastocatellia bacterium]